jgi:hypothetical protein
VLEPRAARGPDPHAGHRMENMENLTHDHAGMAEHRYMGSNEAGQFLMEKASGTGLNQQARVMPMIGTSQVTGVYGDVTGTTCAGICLISISSTNRWLRLDARTERRARAVDGTQC